MPARQSSRPYAFIPLDKLKQMQNELGENSDSFHRAEITKEILQREMEANIITMGDDIRALKKPHWTLVPIFWFTLAALLISLLAYFRPSQPDVRDVKSIVDNHSTGSKAMSSVPTLTMPSKKSKSASSQKKP